MAVARIKEQHKQTTVAFGRSGLPLGLRKQEEINQLAIIAHESNDRRLKDLFEELPSLADLKKSKVELELSALRQQIGGAAVDKTEDSAVHPPFTEKTFTKTKKSKRGE